MGGPSSAKTLDETTWQPRVRHGRGEHAGSLRPLIAVGRPRQAQQGASYL